MKYLVTHDGKDTEIDVCDAGADTYALRAFGRTITLKAHREEDGTLTLRDGFELWRAPITPREPLTVLNAREAQKRELQKNDKKASSGWEIKSPMPGKIVAVLVAVGVEVKAAQGVVTVEAMKMENELRAPQGGIISEVLVQAGQTVTAGAVLIRGKAV